MLGLNGAYCKACFKAELHQHLNAGVTDSYTYEVIWLHFLSNLEKGPVVGAAQSSVAIVCCRTSRTIGSGMSGLQIST